MRSIANFPKIFCYTGIVDFRKQAQSLAALVQHLLCKSPIDEDALYVFVSRDKRKIRILYWDKTGFALWWKGLEKDRFILPRPRNGTVQLSSQQLELLLSGYDVFRAKPHEKIQYERYS